MVIFDLSLKLCMRHDVFILSLSLPGAVVPLYILKKTHISSSFNLISNYRNGGQFALLIILLLYIQADMVPVRNQWLIYSFYVI